MSNAAPLRGRAAVITGGGSGEGAAVARRLSSAGASVQVAARKKVEIEQVPARLRDEGYTAHDPKCDVTHLRPLVS